MDINWIAILVSALVPMFLGLIWYSPMLFGKAWMTSIGKTEEDLKQGNMAVILGISFILSALLAFFLSYVLGFHNEIDSVTGEITRYPHNFGHGAFHGGFIAILVGIPVLVTNSLFEHRSWINILINASYWIVTIAVMGGVLSLFM
ncbi:MAG: DUF1761 domain-containing protein [Chitinophagales bacterium]